MTAADPTPAAASPDPLAALETPGVLGPEPPTRIETHLSVILLSGPSAFKRMRPVSYGFVDFSTPEARRAACFAECARNPMAGDLYLGVRPVLRDPSGALRLGARLTAPTDAAPADAIEHLVEMRRFDRAEEYDRLLTAGALPDAEIDALADLAAETHLAAPTLSAGGAAAVRATLENVAETLARAAPPDLAHADLVQAAGRWTEAIRAAHVRAAPRLDARARHGRVRRCHGDLHLGNIARLDGRPRPFDAIVFNDALSDIDIAYDAAFTLMDLRRLGGLTPATRFLNRYLSATRDYGALAVLPLFVSLRAAIRAMTSLLGGEPDAARPFLTLAEAALAERPPPRLIAVGGGSGVGKSTLAGRLATAEALAGPDAPFGGVWLRSDVARKRLLGLTPERPAPPDAYAETVSQQVLDRLTRDAARALRAGAWTVVDATFLGADWRARLADVAARAGARFDGLWLEAPDAARIARAAAREAERAAGRIAEPSDAGPEIAARQAPERPTEPGWRVLDAGGPPDHAYAAALAALTD